MWKKILEIRLLNILQLPTREKKHDMKKAILSAEWIC